MNDGRTTVKWNAFWDLLLQMFDGPVTISIIMIDMFIVVDIKHLN